MSGTFRFDPEHPDHTPRGSRPRSRRRKQRQQSQAVRDELSTIVRKEVPEISSRVTLDTRQTRRVSS